jgi:hypothetical protein
MTLLWCKKKETETFRNDVVLFTPKFLEFISRIFFLMELMTLIFFGCDDIDILKQ